MDNTNSKILTITFGLTAAVLAFTLSVLLKSFAGAFGIVARLTSTDLVRHGLPIAVGLGVFALLQLNPKIHAWADEVVVEVRKVVWPTRKDVTGMTIVVIIMVLVSAVIISSFDLLSGVLLRWVMGA